MKLQVLFTFCLSVWLNIANGQQNIKPEIILKNYPAIPLCAYSENRIPADTIGIFNEGNRFRVELTDTFNSRVIASYEATYNYEAFHFTIGQDIPQGGTEIHYRVVSSDPAVTSNLSYYTQFFNRGTLELLNSAQTPDPLNEGAELPLVFKATANAPVTATLSDSSMINIPAPILAHLTWVPAPVSEDIFIVRAVNSCNIPVPFSGKVPVKVNSVSIISGKINTPELCGGSEIELTYSTTGGVIPPSAGFRLRFFNINYSNPDEDRIFEIPAVRREEGVLTAKIPEQMVPKSSLCRMAIVVDEPRLVSPYSEPFSIHEKPVATFRYQNDSARIGELYSLYFSVSGPGPHTVELSNGSSYLLDGNRLAKIYPINTETFEIRSLKTPCGVTTDLPRQKVIISVPPGIALLPPAGKNREICENQVMRLPFVSNVTLNSNTRFIAEGRTHDNKLYQFEARLVNDSIEFLIPHSPLEWGTEGYFNIYSFRIKTVDPAYTSEYIHGFTIRGIPRISYDTYESTTLPYPGYLSYNLVVSGGVPFTATDYKGSKLYADHSRKFERVFVPASDNFAPQFVENGCYSTTDIPELRLTVNPYTEENPVAVVHPPSARYVCSPDSIEIRFETLGKFGPENEFQILIPGSETEVWKTVKTPGVYKIPASLVRDESNPYQHIRSTQPEQLWRAAIPLAIDKKPVISSPEDIGGLTPDHPIITGFDGSGSIYIPYNNHSPYTAVFSDGINEYHFVQRSQYATFSPPPTEPAKVTPFVIKSMTNACGTTELNLTVYLYRMQHQIALGGVKEGHIYCAGEEIVVPFVIKDGVAPPGTVFRLRLTKDFKEYLTLATSTTPEDFRYKIPETFEEGIYYISVATDEFTISRETHLIIKKKPTARLIVSGQNGGTPGEVAFGETLKLEYLLTGGGTWKMRQEGLPERQITEGAFSNTVVAEQETLFKIVSVSNSCGYGTVSGEQLVKVKPNVINFRPVSATICSGEALRADYAIGGDIAAGQKIGFYLTDSKGTRFELPSVTSRSGTVSLPVSDNLPGGNYTITCYISETDASQSGQITIRNAPAIELTGHTTINPGEFTYIYIQPKEEGDSKTVIRLSDGTLLSTHLLYPYPHGIRVSPSATTTYTITSATSNCGPAESSGSAIVVVNQPSDRTVRVTGTSNAGSSFCSGDTLLVYFNQTGGFTPDNYFILQLFDKQGQLATTVAASGKKSPLEVLIPDNLTPGEPYRFRLAASDANTAASDYYQALSFATGAAASFAETTVYKDDTGRAKVVVLLEGSSPWRYTYGNDLGAVERYAETSPDTLIIDSREPSAYFRLNSVTNACGAGKIKDPASVSVEVILGSEETDTDFISAGPVPASQEVTITFATDAERHLTLFNLQGAAVWHQKNFNSKVIVDMSLYPAGVYLLKILHKGKVKTLRLVKF